ncbi:MAG: hypothetical protein JJU22_07775 [Gammaproteobacteria bacterium]|nr:hypothetical protein [Gammaproteobacteria bacterium]
MGFEFVRPLMAQLGQLLPLCHELAIDPEGRLVGYRLRQKVPKRMAAGAFQDLRNKMVAGGDPFDDAAIPASVPRRLGTAVVVRAKSWTERDRQSARPPRGSDERRKLAACPWT